MPLDIRPAMPFDDRAQVQDVISAAWRFGHGHLFSAEEIAQVEAAAPGVNIFTTSWTVPNSGVIFLAIDGTRIVGVANLKPFPSDGRPALVEPMHVLPGRQRQGIGEALWRYVEVHSRNRGDSQLDVYALTGNPMAMGFYAKMGGRVVGTGEFRLGDHVERATHFLFKF